MNEPPRRPTRHIVGEDIAPPGELVLRPLDPRAISPEARLAEIAVILGRGYLRLLDSRETCPDTPPGAQESLAEAPESKAACDPGSRSHSTKEVA